MMKEGEDNHNKPSHFEKGRMEAIANTGAEQCGKIHWDSHCEVFQVLVSPN